MKPTLFVATAMLASTSMIAAAPTPQAMAVDVPEAVTKFLEANDLVDDELVVLDPEMDSIIDLSKRDAAPEARFYWVPRHKQDNGWNNRPGEKMKREAEAEPRRHKQDNGWDNRPGEKMKREAEAEPRRHRQDNGWNNRPGEKMKRGAEAKPRRHKQDNGWDNRPGEKVKREAEAEPDHKQDNGWDNRPGEKV